MLAIIGGVIIGVLAWSDLTARLTSLETSELMNIVIKALNRLQQIKNSFYYLKIYTKQQKASELLDKNIIIKMLEHVEKQLEKALNDIEKLKDTSRK